MDCLPELNFASRVFHTDGTVEIALEGELDLSNVHRCRTLLNEMIGPALHALTIDLTNLEFIDVVALRCIEAAAVSAEHLGARVQVTGVSPLVRRVIAIADFMALQAATAPV